MRYYLLLYYTNFLESVTDRPTKNDVSAYHAETIREMFFLHEVTIT